VPRQIIIEFEYGSDKSPPFYRELDFNESLFRLARDDEWMSFPLDQASNLRADCAECWPGSRSS
jgi:hypothetical protein